jgi:hypothetical protein
MTSHAQTARARLPNRRLAETFELEVGGLGYACTIGRFADGTLAELFISNGKAGSDSDGNARDAAITTSIALQYGVPVDVIRKALLRDSRGRQSGPLGVALDMIAGDATP